ncbi:MAG: family 16 glycoside hydrolase, partial [Bacteroidota bacterium]
GKRTAPAKILSIHLNGQLIHENVVLTGPTRGPAFKEEAAKGPLMIQGDHGPVAFRNIRVRRFEPKVIRPENLSYKVYEGIFPVSVPNFDTLTAIQSGKMESLTQEVMQASDKISMHVKGSLKLPTKGTYFFQLTSRGSTMLKIGEKVIFVYGWWDRQATVELAEGEHAFELFYHKPDSWYPPGLGILMSGPGFRKQSLTSISSLPFNSPVNPISVQPGSRPKILRAFIDYPSAFAKEKRRIVHAISVGHAQKAHFTYDPDRASLVQAWRGGFLNTTPMWNNRGDGSARPLGTVLDLGDAADPGLLLKPQADWEATLAEQLGYKFRGYTLDDTGTPTFRYEIDGQMISDKISPRESEPGLQRSIGFPASMPIELHYRLAAGATIEEVDKNLYSIEGSYYVSIPKKQKVRIRSIGQHQEIILTAPANSPAQDLQYEIIW